MTPPDEFFKVNPNLRPGAIPGEGELSASEKIRARKAPPSGDKFKKVLSDDSGESGTKEQSGSEESTMKTKKTVPKANEKVFEGLIKKAKDPQSDQPASLAKESKVAPKLGEEMPTAPSEEPRAKPYVDMPKQAKAPDEADAKLAMKMPDQETMKSEKPTTAEMQESTKSQMAAPDAKAEKALAEDMASFAPMGKEKAKKEGVGDLLSKQKKEKKSPIKEGEKEETVKQNLAATANSDHQAAPVSEGIAKPTPTVTARQEMVDLINQIIDKLSTVSAADTTEVTITLKNLPLFEGANVKVIAHKQAPGEFNVEFSNLTQQAKEVVDNVGNRALLQQSLDQKGYVVHMITTTTHNETLIASESRPSGERQREGFGGGGSGGGQEGDKEKKEEEK